MNEWMSETLLGAGAENKTPGCSKHRCSPMPVQSHVLRLPVFEFDFPLSKGECSPAVEPSSPVAG
jgi:hypothetical protein